MIPIGNTKSRTGAKSLSRLAVALALTCVCLGVAAARAQEPAKPGPSKAAIALARDVIVAKGAAAAFDPLVRGVIESAKNTFLPTNPGLSRELNEVAILLNKEFENRRDEVVDTVATAYALHFTEAELKDLEQFYKTPLGQKLVKEEPVAIQEGFKAASQWSDAFANIVLGRIRNEMAKKGHPL